MASVLLGTKVVACGRTASTSKAVASLVRQQLGASSPLEARPLVTRSLKTAGRQGRKMVATMASVNGDGFLIDLRGEREKGSVVSLSRRRPSWRFVQENCSQSMLQETMEL